MLAMNHICVHVTLADSLNVGAIFMGVLGGLALFLFGMDQMTGALKLLAGTRMRHILGRLTTNRFKSAFAGAFVTSVIQSSSVTTVLVVGFISAGLLSLSQSIGIIMGANIGTTVTAQIIAFKITSYALALVAFGFALVFVGKSDKFKHYGHMIMGLGLVFFGMHLMSEGTKPLRDFEPFISFIQDLENPLLGILAGAIFTAIVQSSSATTGVVIVLASQGYISLEIGISLIFGANIGTCVTAMLAAIGKPREAVRAAVAHVLFNTAGVVLWFAFIPELASLVEIVSPQHTDLEGTARLAADTPRQIANAHTVFNVANTLLFIGFTVPTAALVCWLVPDASKSKAKVVEPRYLDSIVLKTPELALDRVRMELERLGACVLGMIRTAGHTVVAGTERDIRALKEMDNDVDTLHGAIITYLGRLSRENLSAVQSELMHDYLAAANYIENIGDMVQTNLCDAGVARVRSSVEMSTGTRALFSELHQKIESAVSDSITALTSDDEGLAGSVMGRKDEINRLARAADVHLAKRLTAETPNRLEAFRIESDMVESLKRVYYFAKRISKIVCHWDMVSVDQEYEHAPEFTAEKEHASRNSDT